MLAAYLSVLGSLFDGVTLDGVDSVDNLVGRVGLMSGQRMVADADVACMNVYARLNQVPLPEFEIRLAEATHATWTERAGTLTLKRTPAQRDRLRQEAIEAAIPGLERQLSELKPGLEQDGRRFAQALREQMAHPSPKPFYGPTDGLLQEVVKLIGAKRLASLAPYEMALFSNQPTAAEEDLPDLTSLLAKYREISDGFAKDVPEESMQGVLDQYSFEHFVMAAHRATSTGRVLVTAMSTIRGISVSLAVYDDRGQLLSDALHTFLAAPSHGEVELPHAGEKILWPETTDEALKMLGQGHGKATDSTPLMRILKEPLELQAVPGLKSFFAGDVLCPLPDAVVPALFTKRPDTVQDFANALAAGGVNLREDGHWLTGQLLPGYSDPFRYLDRGALRRWVAESAGNSPSWLRRTSTLYGLGGEAVSNGLVTWVKANGWPGLGIKDPAQMTPRWALFALGTLTDGEWDALEQGNAVSGVAIAARLKRIGDWSCSGIDVLERVDGSTGPDTELIGSFSFPGGPPPGSTLTISTVKSRLFANAGSEDGSWMSPGQMANYVCEAPKRPSSEEDALKGVKGRFDLALRPDLKIEVRLGPRLCLRCMQPTTEVTVTAESAALSDWPSDAVEELRSAIRDYLAFRGSYVRSGPPPLFGVASAAHL